MDKVRELQRITDKEHRGVVTDDVPVTFLGVELQGETTWIALSVGRTALSTYRGETQERRGLLANGLEQFGAGVLGNVFCHREGPEGTRTFGVHATLRDVFTVEVSELLDQVKIVEQQGATRAGGT